MGHWYGLCFTVWYVVESEQATVCLTPYRMSMVLQTHHSLERVPACWFARHFFCFLSFFFFFFAVQSSVPTSEGLLTWCSLWHPYPQPHPRPIPHQWPYHQRSTRDVRSSLVCEALCLNWKFSQGAVDYRIAVPKQNLYTGMVSYMFYCHLLQSWIISVAK